MIQIADEIWALDASGTITPGTGQYLMQNGTLERIFSIGYVRFFSPKTPAGDMENIYYSKSKPH